MTTARLPDNLPIVTFATDTEFEAWLVSNDSGSGLWIKIGKKSNPIPSITYAEALDVALCFGWIDGQRRSFDDLWYLQRFTPRRPKSNWSQVNREHIARLTNAGRMRPAGLAVVDAAKADGRWDAAYAGQSSIAVPPDFAQHLAANPDALAFFDSLRSSERFAFLYRLHNLKRETTRTRRIGEYVEMLSRGEKL